jgi:hypothetical protein
MKRDLFLLIAIAAGALTACGGGTPAEECPDPCAEPITAQSPPECIPPIPLPQPAPKGH